MKLSLEILYTSIKDDGLSYGENRTCLATLVFEIYRKQKIVGMWLIIFVTHCTWRIYNHRVREHTIIQRDKLHCNHTDNILDIDK